MRKLFYAGLFLFLFASCEKDDSTGFNPEAEEALNYFPLETGNSWVYKNYEIDSVGNETDLNIMDSVVVTRDTLINGNLYYVLEGTNYPLNIDPFTGENWSTLAILRDSSGYLVNHKGEIMLSVDNFTDTLFMQMATNGEDTIHTITYQMEKPDELINVPAGKFEVINFKGTVYNLSPHKNPAIKNPRYINYYYANNVGKVLQTYFYLNGTSTFEKRLVRYHLTR